MTTAAAHAHPNETGGILIGVYLDGHPWVIAAIEIPTTDRGRSHYRIPGGTDHPNVLKARATDQRLGYLGDWHSHPHDVGPSRTDLASLALISMRMPRQPNPTQIVLRRTDRGYILDARRMVTLVPHACAITLTGGLPAPTSRTDRGDGGTDGPDASATNPPRRPCMTGNEIPSATGVRITGDEYQWLHVWRACMEALHHALTGNTKNPITSIGVEEPGVGNGDDVVRYRQRPPHVYTQVKYAVDNRSSVGLRYLEGEGILKNLATTHKILTANGEPVELRLATNRPHDPTDVLLKDRDGRDSRLLPRAAQGGPNSERGKARTAWSTAACTDEASLMALLNDLHFEIAYELKRLRGEVALLMTANGLRSDDNAVDQCTKWISQQVIAGHRRLTLADINDAVTTLGLRAGSPWATVSIATIKHDELADQAAVSIDWVDRIAGEKPWHRVAPAPPHTWADLADDIATVPARLGSSSRILVTGHMRQATGFLLGTELRRVLGYEVGVRQSDRLWTSECVTESYDLSVAEQHVGSGTDIAIIVNVAANAANQATDWILQHALPVNTILTATPATGPGPSAVASPVAANSLAVALRDLARNHASSGTLHLFLIGPLGLAVLLGHHWNRVTTTLVYEHLGPQSYEHAFTVVS